MTLWLALFGLAAAQDGGLDGHGFKVANLGPDAAAPLAVPYVGRPYAGEAWGGALLEYADAPWITLDSDDERSTQLAGVVAANLAVGLALHERVALSLAAPVFLSSQGPQGTQPAAIGDVRLGVQSGIPLADGDTPVDLGLAGFLDLPSGPQSQNLGQADIGGELLALASAQPGSLRLSVATGPALRPSTPPEDRPLPTIGGDAWLAQGALGYALKTQAVVGLEVRTEALFDPEVRAALGTPLQAMLTARRRLDSGVSLYGGIGTALSRGAGAAPLRLVIGGGFGTTDDPVVRHTLVVRPTKDGEPISAKLTATDASGQTVSGVDELRLEGPPGTTWTLSGTADCATGETRLTMPEGDSAETLVLTTIDDPSCQTRRLVVEPADAMVWIPHPMCEWMPIDEAGDLLAALPADASVQVSAPGYLTQSAPPSGAITLQPAPEQGGLVLVALPGDKVVVDGNEMDSSDTGIYVARVPPGVHTIEVEGMGRTWTDEAATTNGYAVWLRSPDPGPMAVLFGNGSAALSRAAKDRIEEISKYPGRQIYEIRGSYSEEGNLEVNLALGKRRAQAVMDTMLAAGVSADQLILVDAVPPDPSLSSAEQRRVDVVPTGGTK